MVVNAYAAVAVAVALQGDATVARQTVELLKGYSVKSDYRRAKAMALARAQMAVGAWADVIVTLESSDAAFRLDMMLDNLLSGAAFTGRNNWVWTELPRAFMLHKAQAEVGRTDAARTGLDKLLASPELAVTAEIYWQVLVERARIAERDGQPEKALDLYRKARDLVESQRRSIRTEASKIGFAGDKQAIYQGMVRTALKLGNKALALEVAEQAKSRALVDMLATKSDFGIYGQRAGEVAALDGFRDGRLPTGLAGHVGGYWCGAYGGGPGAEGNPGRFLRLGCGAVRLHLVRCRGAPVPAGRAGAGRRRG